MERSVARKSVGSIFVYWHGVMLQAGILHLIWNGSNPTIAARKNWLRYVMDILAHRREYYPLICCGRLPWKRIFNHSAENDLSLTPSL